MKTVNKKKGSKKISWQLYALVLIGVLVAFLRMHSVGDPLTRDLSMYAYDAHELILGSKMYTDIFSMRAPGIQATYVLAELVWGYEESSVYLLGVLFTLISLVFLFLFINLLAGANVALIGVVLYGISSNSLSLGANQPNGETFINTYTIIALWAFAKFSIGHRAYLVLAGLSFAVASLYKQTVLFPFLAMALYIILPQGKIDINVWLKESATKLLKFGLPSVFVWSALFAYFFLNGRFGDFWGDVFSHSEDYA
ncbi:MAG: glycosyltransferase family 39 protein, partial [bacterium]|nr:glycosyltransferase family 39 protein [bacterium]